MSSPVLRRVVRRETHSPRTVAMIVAVIVVILALVYVGTEIVLSVLGQPALLLGPAAAFTGVVGLPTDVPACIRSAPPWDSSDSSSSDFSPARSPS